ncbi:MAG: hypothetical protein NC915_06735, partial [Candidatus Omnitrophica bacterium]|nr:hypothetical protein [Candidatus Omnitrophota bacterium]
MPIVSIILPTIRPEEAREKINAFEKTQGNFDYEIVIVSPFSFKGKKVCHILEESPQGGVRATQFGYENSLGEYICWWSDAAFPTKNCLSNMINFLKKKKPPYIGAFRIRDKKTKLELAQWRIYGKLYACWGCASRKTIEMVGGLFDINFNQYFADPDLALRVWEKGGQVEVCPNAYIEIYRNKDKKRKENFKKYFLKDFETFVNRWHVKIGKCFKKDYYYINPPDFEYTTFMHFLPPFIKKHAIKIANYVYTNENFRTNPIL